MSDEILISAAGIGVNSRRIDQGTVVRLAGLSIGIGEIEPVDAVATCIALAWYFLRITDTVVAIGDVWLVCDHYIRGLDEGCRHTSFDMEFRVTMEKPDTRIIGNEPYRDSHAGIYNNSITSHGCGRSVIKTRPLRLITRTVDDLELMTMEMEWMSSGIVVVQVNFNYLSILDDLRVDLSIDLRVHLIRSGGCQCREEGRDLLWDIRQAIHSSTIRAPVILLEIYG